MFIVGIRSLIASLGMKKFECKLALNIFVRDVALCAMTARVQVHIVRRQGIDLDPREFLKSV